MGECSGMLDIYIIVGLSALLVSINRAIPGPLEREASDRAGSTFFLYMYHHPDKTTVAVVAM